MIINIKMSRATAPNVIRKANGYRATALTAGSAYRVENQIKARSRGRGQVAVVNLKI